MPISVQILIMYAIWFAAIYYVHRLCRRSYPGSVGIPLAYLATMTFVHCGGLSYAIPGYSHLRVGGHWYLNALNFSVEMVRDGVLASMVGVVGIAVGCWLASDRKRLTVPAARGSRPPAAPFQLPAAPSPPVRRPPRSPIPVILMTLAATAFAITKLNINLPSIQAIIMAGRNLAIVAVCLGLWWAIQRRDRTSLKMWGAMTLIVPVVYLVGWGFLSYGFMAMAVFLSFWLSLQRNEKRASLLQTVVICAAVYASFSVFVAYMEVRSGLREVLWNSDASMSQRFSSVISQFSGLRPFNPFDFHQLDWFNIRLNQNMFIGKAMQLHAIAPWLQENGMAILQSLIAWVPRFFWPSKPDMGGNDFVEKHTNMSFADTTTIGAGPIFELFVNFGLIGVFLGTIVLGWCLRWMDAHCARQLRRGDMGRFVRGYLVSVCLINPMSLLFFLVSSAGASWVLGTAIMYAMDLTGLQSPRRRPPPPPPPRRGPEQDKPIWAS